MDRRDRRAAAVMAVVTLVTALAYEATRVPEPPTPPGIQTYQAPVHSYPPFEWEIGGPCKGCAYRPDLPRVVVEEGD